MKGRLRQTGLVQVYTGDGKGKTTAALGVAFRALGHKKRVFLVQFMKKGKDLGECKAGRLFSNLNILQSGRKGWVAQGKLSLRDKELAQKGLTAVRRAIKSKRYDLIITGRSAHRELLKIADLVSEIKDVKHYYRKGVSARQGIEY